MLQVLLSQNKSYKWTNRENIYFRGYFQFENDMKVYRNQDAITELEKIITIDDLLRFLQTIDGCYSIIINNKETTFAAVDRARSMPIYYSNTIISDSAEEIRMELKIPNNKVDNDCFMEFASNSFVIGHNTVYSEIKQLDMGEAVHIDNGNVKHVKYFYHISPITTKTPEEIKIDLTETAYNIFYRLKEVINGRPVVLSMSGGYDSRFVGCMLKNVGIEDVSCYTYGRKDSFEVRQSKKNAEALGYRWKCVEMTDVTMMKLFDEQGLDFMNSFNGHDSIAYTQNFPAVRQLQEEGWIKPESVFITGLCGDMPTGEYVKAKDESKNYDIRNAAKEIYGQLFNSYKFDERFEGRWLKRIEREIEEIPIKIEDYQSYITAIDSFITGTCHSRLYLHQNSVPSYFGYEWLLPYWSVNLLLKWYSVPAEYRCHQILYEDWLMEEICKPYGLNQKKTICLYSSNRWKRRIQYAIGGFLCCIFLNIGIPFRRKQDFNNFSVFELELFKRLKTKRLVRYKKAGAVHMICHYLSERKYGIDNYELFVKNSKVKIDLE